MLSRIIFCQVLAALALQSHAFLSQSTRRFSNHVVTNMATVLEVNHKQKQLDLGREKYAGRGDLVSMIDAEENEVDTYSFFAEADQDEVDPPKVGQTITGIVIEMDDNGALLEIGGKMSGYLPLKEAALIPIKHVNTVLEMGQEVTAEVIGTLKGMPVISLRAAQLITAWEQAVSMRATDATFDAKVIEVNRGGVVCAALGLKAFLPGSHYIGTADESIIGQTLKVKFLDVNEDDGKLVISQKRAMMDGPMTELRRGSVVGGTITGLRNYGAFLELDGGVSGLLHISQVSYDRIDNLETLFTIGQRCKVMILEHDKANGRVALSTKTLEPTPGDMLRNMETVFSQAEATAASYHERLGAERLAREAAAKEIVAGLGGSASGGDPLVSVAESIESILASIVSDAPLDGAAPSA